MTERLTLSLSEVSYGASTPPLLRAFLLTESLFKAQSLLDHDRMEEGKWQVKRFYCPSPDTAGACQPHVPQLEPQTDFQVSSHHPSKLHQLPIWSAHIDPGQRQSTSLRTSSWHAHCKGCWFRVIGKLGVQWWGRSHLWLMGMLLENETPQKKIAWESHIYCRKGTMIQIVLIQSWENEVWRGEITFPTTQAVHAGVR